MPKYAKSIRICTHFTPFKSTAVSTHIQENTSDAYLALAFQTERRSMMRSEGKNKSDAHLPLAFQNERRSIMLCKGKKQMSNEKSTSQKLFLKHTIELFYARPQNIS